MATVTVEHVYKRFGAHQTGEPPVTALEDVSFKVADGDVLGVVGPSGCGKSTLLRIVAGLVEPDSGQVLFDNIPLRDIDPRDRGIGMVFQEGALAPHWEAKRSVGFFLWLRKRDDEVPERVRRISQITGVGLEALMERMPRQLSGGEQQRVGIARALARDPRVFLFDEPFSNIDAKLRTSARIELKRLLNEFPVTSIYVTHDQVEAMALAHRIAVMREGRIEQIGSYAQLYSNPINLFVATFIGPHGINLFKGHAQSHHWQGEAFGGYRIRGDLTDGQAVTLGVRAESILPAAEGVAGVVESITPYFAERQLLLEVRAGRERWLMTVPQDMRVNRGDTLHCVFDPGALVFFDSRTGVRIG